MYSISNNSNKHFYPSLPQLSSFHDIASFPYKFFYIRLYNILGGRGVVNNSAHSMFSSINFVNGWGVIKGAV